MTVTRQRRGCDLNPGPTAPESSTPNPLGYRATGEVINLKQITIRQVSLEETV